MNPYGDYHGGDIDSISMENGALHLHIPIFIDHSQRGNLNFTYGLTYTSNSWILIPPNPCNGCNTYTVETAGYPFENARTPLTFSQFGSLSNQIYTTTRDNNGLLKDVFFIRDGDGTTHHLSDMKLGATRPGNWESFDGSGILVTTDVNNGSGVVVTRRDGVKFDYPTNDPFAGYYIQDPNGNQITATESLTGAFVLTTMVDTLGRTWSQTATTDFTHCPVAATSAFIWSVPGFNGQTATYKFCYATVSSQTNFSGTNIVQDRTTGGSMGVVLPNLTAWRLDYNSWGDIQKITLPTGGSITYGWTYPTYISTSSYCGGTNGTVTSRTVFDGTNSYTWNYNYGNVWHNTGTTIITDPLGNDTVATNFQGCQDIAGKISYYTGLSSNGNVVKTVTTTYQAIVDPYNKDQGNFGGNPALPLSTTTTWANGQVSQEARTYDPGLRIEDNVNGDFYCPTGGCWGVYGLNPTESHYDYGNGSPGAPLSTTNNSYLYRANSAYYNANILEPKSSMVTLNGGGFKCAETDYGYDDPSRLVSSGVTEQHFAAPSSVRGNLTSVTRQLSSTPCQSGGTWTPINSYRNVYDTGLPQQTIDPLTHTTTYSYSPTYYGAYSTTVTNALNQSTTLTYDFNTGRIASTKDPNQLTTTFSYDSMQRLTATATSDGGQMTECYSDTGGSTCAQSGPPYQVTKTVAITSAPNVNESTTTVFDEFGRATQLQLTTDPDGITYTDIHYDALGRVAQESNPYRTKTDPTYGSSSFLYDPLGRICVITPPDGTVPSGTICPATAPSNDIFTVYSGNSTTATDQAGKSRKSVTDGLGRLTQVFEDPSNLNYETDYSYDANNNLLTVNQRGGSSNSANWRTRTFSYDSLSRLSAVTSPESGTANYSYDADGDLLLRNSPAPNQTSSATVTISYCYDALSRITGKAYTAQTCSNGLLPSPLVSYFYDQASYSGLTIANGIGRRTGMADQAGSEAWSYDIMGRVAADNRTTNGLSKPVTYAHNLDGSLKSLSYSGFANGSSPATFFYTPGGAGRPLALLSGTSTFVGDAHYTASGANCYLQDYWDGTWTSVGSFNNRLQPKTYQVVQQFSGTAPTVCTAMTTIAGIMDFSYNFVDANSHNNGNVQSISNNIDWHRAQYFSYDSLNRISTAVTAADNKPAYQGDNSIAVCWAESYTYDAWGNILTLGPNATTQSNYVGCTQESGFNYTGAIGNNNRIAETGFSYDAAGNMTASPGPSTYVYDAENHLTSAVTPFGSATYTYDGDGKRLTKSTGTIYWYGTSSDAFMETDLSNNMRFNYFFFNGQRVAREDTSNSVNWYFADHLGSSRVVWSLNGSDDSDYYPFGGERVITTGANNHYKFTGKERDAETGNDYFGARYFSSTMGRWTTPDLPFADQHLEAPQSWNLYQYGRLNPLTNIDSNGRVTWVIGGTWYNPKEWDANSPIAAELRVLFNDPDVILIPWSGGNSSEARAGLARNIVEAMNAHDFKPGEQNNVVCSSHGCNGFFAALPELAKDGFYEDNLVTLGVPMRSDYRPDTSNLNNWYNIYSPIDIWQEMGGRPLGFGGHTNPNATNFEVNWRQHSALGSHSALHNDRVARTQWELFIRSQNSPADNPKSKPPIPAGRWW